MDLKLSGKVAIVTGGSAGIGLACAKALYSEGVNVAIVSRNLDKLEQAANSIRSVPDRDGTVIPISADLTQTEAAKQVVSTVLEHFGQIDVLINNAGAPHVGSFLDLGDEAYLDTWNLKPLGYIRLIRAAAPSMIKNGMGESSILLGRLDGCLVQTSSLVVCLTRHYSTSPEGYPKIWLSTTFVLMRSHLVSRQPIAPTIWLRRMLKHAVLA